MTPVTKAKTVAVGVLGLFGWAYGYTWTSSAAGAPALPAITPPAPGTPAAAPHVAAPLTGSHWARANLTATHHDYPAIDVPVPTGTALHSMITGTASLVGGTCGNGIRVTGDRGVAVKFCHATRLHVTPGAAVTAGQHIADAGATGHADGPHLHLEILAGRLRCPQPALIALRQGQPVDFASLPTSGCTH